MNLEMGSAWFFAEGMYVVDLEVNVVINAMEGQLGGHPEQGDLGTSLFSDV